MSGRWFAEGDLDGTLRSHAASYVAKVADIASELIRFSPDAVVDHLLEEADVVPLTFHWDEVTRGQAGESLVRQEGWDGPVSVPAKSIQLSVPFDGDPVLLRARANSYSLSGFPYDMAVEGKVVRLKIAAHELNASDVTNTLNRFRADLEQRASWANNQVAQWRQGLHRDLGEAVQRRRQQLEDLAALDDALTIPLASSNQGERVTVPLAAKRIPLPSPTKPQPQDPALELKTVNEILSVIDNLGRAQERLPKTASKFKEEELRDLILFNLNANFAGAAKAEVFSGNGKTDIFLDWNGRGAFIAECKVWRGEKQFSAAIDQLLSYVVWRDSKAAMILFIRGNDATGVIAKANAALETHPRSIIHRNDGSTGLDHYMMKSATDPDRLIDVAFVPFVLAVPAKSVDG